LEVGDETDVLAGLGIDKPTAEVHIAAVVAAEHAEHEQD